MGQLFQDIKRVVREERYVVSSHADQRLRERRIERWQVIAGLEDGKLLAEHPRSTPLPSIEVEQLLADGTAVKAVWGYVAILDAAKLVTVHFL
jgi:hypothetical protein